jgi:hypothetical protein
MNNAAQRVVQTLLELRRQAKRTNAAEGGPPNPGWARMPAAPF